MGPYDNYKYVIMYDNKRYSCPELKECCDEKDVIEGLKSGFYNNSEVFMLNPISKEYFFNHKNEHNTLHCKCPSCMENEKKELNSIKKKYEKNDKPKPTKLKLSDVNTGEFLGYVGDPTEYCIRDTKLHIGDVVSRDIYGISPYSYNPTQKDYIGCYSCFVTKNGIEKFCIKDGYLSKKYLNVKEGDKVYTVEVKGEYS